MLVIHILHLLVSDLAIGSVPNGVTQAAAVSIERIRSFWSSIASSAKVGGMEFLD